MFSNQRSVQFISLGGHLSTLDRHESLKLNDALNTAMGFDVIKNILQDLGFKIGKKFSKNKRLLLRSDDTEINNAYLDGNHEMIRVKMNDSFSPLQYMENKDQFKKLIDQSKFGPGHLYEAFNEE